MSDFNLDWSSSASDSQNTYIPAQQSHTNSEPVWSDYLYLDGSDSSQRLSPAENLPQHEPDLPTSGEYAQLQLVNVPPLQAHGLYSYDGYSDIYWQSDNQPVTQDHGFDVSVADSEGPRDIQSGNTASTVLEVSQPSHEGSINRDIHAHSDYPPTSDSHHAGSTYNPTTSHAASSSSHTSNPQPTSDMYYFARSHSNPNDPQLPSDPMPEVTQKLGQSVRPSKRAKCSQTKFRGSKYTSQDSHLSMVQEPSLLPPVPSPEFIRDIGENARVTMIKSLFQENLFPSATENSDIARKALDDTIARYSVMEGANGNDLFYLKAGPSGKNMLARMKAALKEIHGDFEQVASLSWIPAYTLSHDLSMTRLEMQTTRSTKLNALLKNFMFTDEIITVTMNDGTIVTYRIPFGHSAIFDLLEQVIHSMQYSRYILLDKDNWQPRLTNAIFLAATSRGYSLQKALGGPWLGAAVFQSEDNRSRYLSMKSRVAMFSDDEFSRFSRSTEHTCQGSAQWSSRIKDAIDSYIKAADPSNFAEVIKISSHAGKHDDLIDTELAYAYAKTDRLHDMDSTVDRELTARCIVLLNRADPELHTYMLRDVSIHSPRYLWRLCSTAGTRRAEASICAWLVLLSGDHGVRTFSAKEMTFNILGLMHPFLFSITQIEPIWADLNGGVDRLPDLADPCDEAGRSIPAPSRGALSVAREFPSKYPLPTSLNLDYRSRQIAFRHKQISEWLDHELAQLQEEMDALEADGGNADKEFFSSRVSDIEKEARGQEKEALATYGMLKGADAHVTFMRS
ncbi:hypothetical protein EDD22DRAFT_989641 [Suillus occidentalis]|nr:hypothetical protein EDD22DRAFT_989641 [Suillus occidentalis]